MLEWTSLFFLGGGAYAALELAWRGTTHWTMFLAGGACLCLLQWLAAQGFDPLTQSALYWQLDGDAPEANTMHIRVQDASLGWNTAALDEKIAACFMNVEPGEYTRVCRLIERTIYGGDAPDLREERAMRSFLFKLAASAREEPLHTRLRLRYTCL